MILDKEDVYALIGHAALLRGQGQTEMPKFFMELAHKISVVIGDEELQAHVFEAEKASGKAA